MEYMVRVIGNSCEQAFIIIEVRLFRKIFRERCIHSFHSY